MDGTETEIKFHWCYEVACTVLTGMVITEMNQLSEMIELMNNNIICENIQILPQFIQRRACNRCIVCDT